MITNTGSTNTTGYSIAVGTSGQVRYRATHLATGGDEALKTKKVPKALAQKLFHDLKAAMPLAQLPVRHTFRSVSFGTSTYIEYQGQRTLDITSPAEARGEALRADITQIAAALHITNAPRFSVQLEVPDAPFHRYPLQH